MRELPNGGTAQRGLAVRRGPPRADARVKNGQRGPRALMDAVGYTLNLKIDYYALVNMFGFATWWTPSAA
ncbi:hypothetical protein GCM10018952_39950 [Streptosporangium vulgare]